VRHSQGKPNHGFQRHAAQTKRLTLVPPVLFSDIFEANPLPNTATVGGELG
jgi:hypothetical protein